MMKFASYFYFQNAPLYQKYSKVQYSTVQYCTVFCKAVPHAVVFIAVFQVYVNYFILKLNYNESDEKPFFEVILWLNFKLRSFLHQGTS